MGSAWWDCFSHDVEQPVRLQGVRGVESRVDVASMQAGAGHRRLRGRGGAVGRDGSRGAQWMASLAGQAKLRFERGRRISAPSRAWPQAARNLLRIAQAFVQGSAGAFGFVRKETFEV
jgi:hypothetical protein